jgi:hypothetical protein
MGVALGHPLLFLRRFRRRSCDLTRRAETGPSEIVPYLDIGEAINPSQGWKPDHP